MRRTSLLPVGACIATLALLSATCTIDFERYRYAGTEGVGAGGAGGSGPGPGGGGNGGSYTGPGATMWAVHLGGSGFDIANHVAIAPNGDVIVFGSFAGGLQIEGNSHIAGGTRDIFLARFGPDGAFRWSRTYGGTAEVFAGGVAVDQSGDIVIVGTLTASANLGGGDIGSGQMFRDIYLAKYSSSGDHVWSNAYGTPDDHDDGDGIAINLGGTIAITGSFRGTMLDFGMGALASAGQTDQFIALFNPGGTAVYAERFGDASFNTGNDVAFSADGDVVVTGATTIGIDFGGGLLVNTGGAGVVVAKLSTTGMHVFSDLFSSVDADQGLGVTTDVGNDVLLTGLSSGDIDFGGGDEVGRGGADIYAAKLDGAGIYVWSDTYGDTQGEHGRDIAINGAGEVHIVGQLQGGADFGGGVVTSAGDRDAFMVKLGPDGAYQFERVFGDEVDQRAHGVAVDETGIYVVGELAGTVDFDGTMLVSAGEQDGFLIKLQP